MVYDMLVSGGVGPKWAHYPHPQESHPSTPVTPVTCKVIFSYRVISETEEISVQQNVKQDDRMLWKDGRERWK